MDVNVTRLKALIWNSGYEPRRYAGRTTRGLECLGVGCCNPVELYANMLETIRDTGDDPLQLAELGMLMRNTMMDRHGEEVIVYWPGVPFESR